MSINGKQSVKLEIGITDFENYFKQIPVKIQLMNLLKQFLRSINIAKK